MLNRTVSPAAGYSILAAILFMLVFALFKGTEVKHGTMPSGPLGGTACHDCLYRQWEAAHPPKVKKRKAPIQKGTTIHNRTSKIPGRSANRAA